MNNYVKSLASYIFKKMNDYQTDEQVRKEKPMLWPAGIYFTEDNFPKKNLLSKIVGLILLGDNELKCVLSSKLDTV